MTYTVPSSLTKETLPAYFDQSDIRLDEFKALCSQSVDLATYPTAETVQQNIVIYQGDKLYDALLHPTAEIEIKAELIRCLKDGPGVFVIKGAYPDTAVIDGMTDVFKEIVAQEKAAGGEGGDHFGQNERIWNSIQKACVLAPELFVDYYGNAMLALASHAWLGPYYQITAQMNSVKPGSKAQSSHRDYHLGFQSRETTTHFPVHTQMMSQYLTLQGAIAHGDMPLESGPTLFLPFSQQYPAGYLTFHDDDFAAYFDDHKVQIPFQKGDAVFFSPALFHGAGTNVSNSDRIANLVQISSAFGRPMESVNRYAMIEKVYPILLEKVKADAISARAIQDTIAALADGYSFPTNLDSDPPLGGNVPVTAQQLVHQALQEYLPWPQLKQQLDHYAQRRQA
ncbi:MAG: phytanoyl-CoA dioxygenase family protein [Anaerolineae bacterium]|nr:phytanoyl-CoA dioxygenase family protein [Anaerolineae bacterium]